MPSTSITFKTLNQKTFKIEIDDEEKVSQLKAKIHEERGDEFPTNQQRLIHQGKILADDTIIKECGIDPVKTFVVIMAIKPKPVPGAPAQSSSTAPPVVTTAAATATVSSVASSTAVPAPSATSASGQTTSTTSTETETQPTAQTAVSETSAASTVSQLSSAESQLVTGTQQEAAITELMGMGFSRDQVTRAMQQSFNNPDAAANFLLGGENNALDFAMDDALGLGHEAHGEEGHDSAVEQAIGDLVPPGAAPAVAPSTQGSGESPLDFLRNLPQFDIMRRAIQENPGALPQLLGELGRTNPQLLTLINSHQQEFIGLLNEPVDEGAGGGTSIQVTTEEKAKIDNIVAMGFPEQEVVQAFFACDKNEQQTLNLLCDHMDD